LKRSTGFTPSGIAAAPCLLGAPCAVVAGLFLGGHLLFTQRVQLLHAHIAGVDIALFLQRGQHLLVAIHALHLVERTFVVVQLQPFHAFQDHVHGSLGGALQIGVFNAQHEVAAIGARKSPG
jgi:hypothetical protein